MAAYSCPCSAPAGSSHCPMQSLLFEYLSRYSILASLFLSFPFSPRHLTRRAHSLVWREWMHVRTNSAEKYCFVSNLKGFLSSPVCGSKTSSGRKDVDVGGSSSAQGWGRAGSFLSLAVLAQSVCVTAGCSDKSSLSWSKDAFCQLLLALCCWWVLLLYVSLLLYYSVTCPRAQVPTVPFQLSPCPLHYLPESWSHCFTWLIWRKKMQGEAILLLLNQPAPSKGWEWQLMCDCVYLPCSVFGLLRFLTCLYPAAGRAGLVQCKGGVPWAETQGRAHKYWHTLKLCSVRSAAEKKRQDNLKKHFCII